MRDSLKDMAKYFLYLPQDKEKMFKIFIIEKTESGKFLGELIEKLYSNAEVYWMNMPEEYEKKYDGQADILIFYDTLCDNNEKILEIISQWLNALKENGAGIFHYENIMKKYHYGHIETVLYSKEMALEQFDDNGLFVARKKPVDRRKTTFLCKYQKIYVICPAFHKSGGPEVIHQLVYWINRLGGEAYIAYGNADYYKIWTNMEFYEYVRGHVLRISDIPDIDESLVVVPEAWADCAFSFQNAKVILWWLSVDNMTVGNMGKEISSLVKHIDEVVFLHMVQSAYSYDFLVKNHVDEKRIKHLADYLNDTYLYCEWSKEQKQDIVAYNPKKGAEFTKKLIGKAEGIRFIPIQNMTTDEVNELLVRAKIYIDFGNHPGKDRIPREAAMSGCVVITGKRGSAAFYEDVSIPDKYKFRDDINTIPQIVNAIEEVINNYNIATDEFETYRKKILEEKNEFVNDIKQIFF